MGVIQPWGEHPTYQGVDLGNGEIILHVTGLNCCGNHHQIYSIFLSQFIAMVQFWGLVGSSSVVSCGSGCRRRRRGRVCR